MGIRIEKVSSYLPKKIVTNNDFEKILDTSDQWIRKRTGIEQRHFKDKEKLEDLVINSVEKLNLNSEEKENIKAVIVATCTSKYQIPSLASLVKEKFLNEFTDIYVLDINSACSGYVQGLEFLNSYLKENESALLIGAEAFSDILDFTDRTTSILFGDGAGASFISKNSESAVFKTISIGNSEVLKYKDYLTMDGKEVYKFAVHDVYNILEDFLKNNNINKRQVDKYIFHQANIRIINSIQKALDESSEKFPINLNKTGNLSSASIPVLLSELIRKDRINRGENIVLVGFGAGLVASIAYLKW